MVLPYLASQLGCARSGGKHARIELSSISKASDPSEIARRLDELRHDRTISDSDLNDVFINAECDPDVRGLALETLVLRKSTMMEEVVVKGLADFFPEVRTRAALLSSNLPQPRVLEALAEAVDDPVPDVRQAVILQLMGKQSRVAAKAVYERFQIEREPSIRKLVVEYLPSTWSESENIISLAETDADAGVRRLAREWRQNRQ